jgi:hypothetical protein
MKIHLSEPGLVPDLVAFLREHGCVATAEGAGEITVLAPDPAAVGGTRTVTVLAEQWRYAHPRVEFDVLP